MKLNLVIHYKLNEEIKLPIKFINAVPKSGPADSAIKQLRKDYNVLCDKQDAVNFLSAYGVWDVDNLLDHEENINRIIWLSTLDCAEKNTNYFYMGE